MAQKEPEQFPIMPAHLRISYVFVRLVVFFKRVIFVLSMFSV